MNGGSRSVDAPRVVVVGAGAAGLLAAIFAARAGAAVTLLESRPKPGAKIRVSGGGRCNLLPSVASLDDFHTFGSVTAMRNVLFSWPLAQVRRFFEEELEIPLKVEPTGKVFPRSDSSKEVVDALLAASARAGVVLAGGAKVRALSAGERGFQVSIEGGDTLAASRVILATGGLSLPKSGSEGAGYAFARSLGHTIRPRSPALVSLTAHDPSWADLAGVALPVTARVDGSAASPRGSGGIAAAARAETREVRRGDFLFTHEGFSGPVILDVSRHFTAETPEGAPARLLVGWGEAAGRWDELLRSGGRGSVGSVLRAPLPRRLADRLLERARVRDDAPLATLSRESRGRLTGVLEATHLEVAGNGGYAKAEVTQGGLPLEEVRLDSLESRRVPGLYFAGEIFDVTGRVGGFNFLWAWVTGRKAGLAAARAAG